MNGISSQPMAVAQSNRDASASGNLNESSRRPWLESGLELEYPYRTASSVGLGHIPFLFWIVEAASPRVIVELGVGHGNSYCAFLQAARQLRLDARCSGIDPWIGSSGEEEYLELRSYHDPLYGAFSTLLRSPFNQAISHLGDGTIDLLYVDSARSADAICDNFNVWLPKMSSRGIVILQHPNEHADNGGAWQVWTSLRAHYPVIEFTHSGRLGVAYVGSEPLSASLQTLFDTTSSSGPSQIQRYFARLGIPVEQQFTQRERLPIAQASSDPDNTLNEAKINVSDRDKNMQGLRQQMALVIRLQHEIAILNRHKLFSQQILRSTSWRLTAPLRWLVSNGQLLLQKLRG